MFSAAFVSGPYVHGMRRAILILLPFLAAIVAILGGFYVYTGGRLLMAGNVPAGLAFAGFGLGGFILAAALWSLRRTLRSQPPR